MSKIGSVAQISGESSGLFWGDGRIGRLPYFGISLGCGLPVVLIQRLFWGTEEWPVGLMLFAVLTWIHFVAAIKRLHDIDKSGWYVLLFIVPLVNIVLGLVLLFRPGSMEANVYGMPLRPDGPDSTSSPKPPTVTASAPKPTASLSTDIELGKAPASFEGSPAKNSPVRSGPIGSSNDFWAMALAEFDGANRLPGLWAKAFAESGGNESVAKAIYLRERAIRLERSLRSEAKIALEEKRRLAVQAARKELESHKRYANRGRR